MYKKKKKKNVELWLAGWQTPSGVFAITNLNVMTEFQMKNTLNLIYTYIYIHTYLKIKYDIKMNV